VGRSVLYTESKYDREHSHECLGTDTYKEQFLVRAYLGS